MNPCDYITREMIVCHFGGSSAELELIDDYYQVQNPCSQCGYLWKKTNYEEIRNDRTNVMMAYASIGTFNNHKNEKEEKSSDLSQLESPSNHIKIGHFRKYDDYKSAIRDFKNTHSVPSKEELKKALNQLSNRQKEVIYLHFYNGMSYSEIEDILAINRQSVRNHMYRGMETLRSVLHPDVMRLVITITIFVLFLV
jgi:RNA polymerase sigma factor (sigma-70 family)